MDAVDEAAGFLRGFPPFDAASDDELAAIAAAATVEEVPAGQFLLLAGEAGGSSVRVLRRGHVELLADGRVVDVLGEGELVGLPSAVADLPPGLDARAAENLLAYRLPTEVILPLLAGRSGLRFLARTVRRRSLYVRRDELGRVEAPARVGDLVRAVVTVEPGQGVGEVVAAMRDSDASCALVHLPDGVLGIVTDHDLRTRLLAVGADAAAQPGADPSAALLATPIGTLASVPAITVDARSSADDAVLTVLAKGIRHLPVRDEAGRVLGVVEDVDLLAAQSRTPVRLRRAVGRAATPAELVEAAQGIRPWVVDAALADGSATTIAGTLGVLVEAVVAKAVELHLRARGVPPCPFVWLVTGSVARGEAVLASDLDTMLAWDGPDDDGPARRWMRSFAAEVLRTLGACGLAGDEHGMRADDPRCSRSVSAWRKALAQWAIDPLEQQGDIYLSALLDARPVWGHAAWGPVAQALAAAAARPVVRATLQRVASAVRPPTGFVRDLVIESSGEHAGTLDLRRGGAGPIVAVGRYLTALLTASSPGALSPTAPIATADRLRAAASRGLVREPDARDLTDALAIVTEARLRHQVRLARRGQAPDEHLAPDELATLERRALRDAFRVVARVQRALPPPVVRA